MRVVKVLLGSFLVKLVIGRRQVNKHQVFLGLPCSHVVNISCTILVGDPLQWSLQHSRAETSSRSMQFEVEDSDITNGCNVTYPPIGCLTHALALLGGHSKKVGG